MILLCLKTEQNLLGIISKINTKIVTFKSCDTTGFSIITFQKKDVNYVTKNYASKSLPLNMGSDNYFHIGIIPYQLLTRSSGLYVRYDFKNISVEYRPTYTYAFPKVTDQVTGDPSPIYYDNYYFQGINNSFVFYKLLKQNRVGFIISYKYWWHGNQSIYNDVSSYAHDDPDFKEVKSTYMNGIGMGAEYTHDFSNAHFDCSFFANATVTNFIAQSHVVSLDGGSNIPPSAYNQTYPYDETKDRFYVNITAGFKFGYRKKLKK